MSGTLEQLIAALNANTAALLGNNALAGSAPQQTHAIGLVSPPQQPVAPINVPSNITADTITALIQPHIGNDAIKADLGAAMRSLGINGLPETQPHQYGQLYALFQGVLAKYGIGGAAQPTATSTSII